MRLRYSAWTLPWLLDFKQKVASIPVLPGSGAGSIPFLTTAGQASATINLATFADRLDQVIADDEGSLIRVYDGDTIIDEWIAKKGSRSIATDTKTFPLTGRALASRFDQYLVPPFDNGTNPAVDPGWKWGGDITDGDNLLKNPSFETSAWPNGGFELGSVGSWTNRAGGVIRAVLNAVEAFEGDYHGEIVSIGAAGDGAEDSISGLEIGETYTLTLRLNDETAAGDRYRVGVTDAISGTHTNAYVEDEILWAEIGNATQGNGASTGVYQTTTLAFTATAETITVIVEAPDGAAADLKVDGGIIAGYEVGISPWYALSSRVNVCELSNDWADDGSQSCKIQADDLLYVNPYTDATGYAYLTGIGQQVGLTVGKTYNAGIMAYQESGSDQTLLLIMKRLVTVGDIGSGGSTFLKHVKVVVPDSTPTPLVIDEFIPDVASFSYEVRWQFQGADDPGVLKPGPTYYVDSAYLAEGLPATDAGDILTTLFDAHPDIGNWIDYSSFGATDSNGDAWPEDIAFEVQWGEHYGHVLDRLVDLKYEWELVPKAAQVGNLTHDFHLYAPGGRDATYQNGGTPTTAINKGQSTAEGEVAKRIPDYTSVLLEGAGKAWSKEVDATTEAQFGVLEKFVANRQLLNETTRVLAAEQYLAYEEANRTAARIGVTASRHHPRPMVAYKPGDSIPWQIPPAHPKESRRVQRIDYNNSHPTSYVVTGSRLLDGEAAAYDLIWRLWRRFTRPKEAVATSGGTGDKGGHFTIQVAAVDASVEAKGKADPGFQCVGTDDHVVIMAAQFLCWQAGGGEVWLSEGTYSCDPDQIIVGYDVSYPEPITIHGAANGATVIELTGSETNWGVLVTTVGKLEDVLVEAPPAV